MQALWRAGCSTSNVERNETPGLTFNNQAEKLGESEQLLLSAIALATEEGT
jgi:hypothetical protein